MTDLELVRLCAEAMMPFSHSEDRTSWRTIGKWLEKDWNPLRDDAQAMALVKKFYPILVPGIRTINGRGSWHVEIKSPDWDAYSLDLNRAICECVAKMQKAKHG